MRFWQFSALCTILQTFPSDVRCSLAMSLVVLPNTTHGSLLRSAGQDMGCM